MKTINIELSDRDVQVLSHDLLDVDAWVKGMVAGKINSCRKRLLRDGREIMVQAGEKQMPTYPDELEDKILQHPAYKSRAGRDPAMTGGG